MKRIAILVAVSLVCLFPAGAQNLQKMYEYDFDGALAEYRDSLAAYTDSLKRVPFETAARLAENGISLTEYCVQPAVVARERFSKEDFFLYYPLPDKSWHRIKDTTGVVFSLSAARDTLVLDRRDSLLYFPMVCGKEKYFASENLYGMGGYDLYVSHWDESNAEWGAPENLGFPYSSPFNDYLFMNTYDGRYSIFASDRGCPEDSVNVYVLEYEANPVHKAISDPKVLKQIAVLDPPVSETKKKAGKEPDEQTARYMSKLAEVRSIRSAISTATRDLDTARETYSVAEGEEKTKIASSLEEGEMKIAALRMDLDKASRELRDIEMDFLLNGVEINIDDFTESGEVSDSGEKFRFVRREFGDPYIVVWNTQN